MWPKTVTISHSDHEMRHGRKSASRRFNGHKMDVVSDEGLRDAQNEPATKALLRRRSKAERKIDHLQDLGMRQARYRGRRRTRL